MPSEPDDLSEDSGCGQHSLFSSGEIDTEDNLALDDAENPLQLLARASDLQLSPAGVHNVQKSPLQMPQATRMSVSAESQQLDGLGTKSFFVPVRASRDVGPDIDPVDMGLVTLYEAESLFTLYAYFEPELCSSLP